MQDAIEITDGGEGYDLNPVPITFTLNPASRRLKTDSPFKEVFDLQDTSDADAYAKLWVDTIRARCVSAKHTLIAQTSSFDGETVTTV